jgi:ABC-type uncharacterized transport system substrate-binding protein
LEFLLKNNLIKGGSLDNAIVIIEKGVEQDELDRLADLFNKPRVKAKKQGILNEKDLIFAIATPAAQAAFNSTKDIPIIVTAVTDPVKAGLVSSIEKSNTNVAGTSDEVPLDKQFKLLKDILPQSKKIGILYNTSEVNSEVQIEKAKEIAGKYDLEIIYKGLVCLYSQFYRYLI